MIDSWLRCFEHAKEAQLRDIPIKILSDIWERQEQKAKKKGMRSSDMNYNGIVSLFQLSRTKLRGGKMFDRYLNRRTIIHTNHTTSFTT